MIKLSKEVLENIGNDIYYNEDDFISDAKNYISAVQSGRILYRVTKVARSGMSRNIEITSFEGKMSKGYYRSYSMLLGALGYKIANCGTSIKVSGCGMNMLFATNYNIINSLHNMGFLSKKKCGVLAQKVN